MPNENIISEDQDNNELAVEYLSYNDWFDTFIDDNIAIDVYDHIMICLEFNSPVFG